MACSHTHHDALAPTKYRRVLSFVLGLNIFMCFYEFNQGLFSGSVALQADALEFLGDSITFAITLLVIHMSLKWRARAALLKGLCMGAFGTWVFFESILHYNLDTVPEAHIMGNVAVLALMVNVLSAFLMYRFRTGDSNLRSVWLCSRNDAISNLAVLLAASGVFYTEAGWPDWIVAGIISSLALTSGYQIIRHALAELSLEKVPTNS